MSRSGYTDDCENLALWRGAVDRAIKGRRGQKALRELATALDAMPIKALAAESLVNQSGEFCTLGVLGNSRGLPIEAIDPEDSGAAAQAFDIAQAMVREIVYLNDEADEYPRFIDGHWCRKPETPQERWARMRAWVDEQISKE